MQLSLVIPAYNEEDRLDDTLVHVVEYLSDQAYDWEVLVVNDGSTDGTLDLVREKHPEVQLLSYDENRGKGHAVKLGMERARGEYRFYFDADASTPIEELEKAWPRFDDGADIVVGSRSLRESNVEVHQAWYRENMGRIFNLCLRILGLTHMPDTQCGFKGFTDAACDVVLPRQTIDRFAFDAELLYVAQLHSLRIDQIPVRWINCRKSRLNPITDSTAMFFEILGIRLNQLLGKYK